MSVWGECDNKDTNETEYDVSVIMPSLNVRPYIQECLESVQKQTDVKLEILCIDADSTDGTYEFLLQQAQNDKRITVVKSAIKSYGYQMNLGISIAKGKYIGIVETDDFIKKDMFSTLTKIALENHLDFVKADYDGYYESNVGRIFTNYRTFPNDNAKYQKVLNSKSMPEIFYLDQSVWKGIYDRKFILSNQITFHESKGAAYQDIGFMMQVLTKSTRGMYISDSFYCYRVDREDSSSFKPQVLQFVKNEFRWLLDEKGIEREKGLICRLATAFLSELSQLIKREQFDINNEVLLEAYEWICSQLLVAIQEKIIVKKDFSKQMWVDLLLAIEDLNTFYNKQKNLVLEKQNQIRSLLEYVTDKEVVIWGAGAYGRDVLRILSDYHVTVEGFIDGNSDKWNTLVGDIKIYSKDEMLSKHKNAVYVIANKTHYQEIFEELSQCGIMQCFIWK